MSDMDAEYRRRMHVFRRDQPVVTHCPSETTYEAWINIPIDKKLEAGQLLRICAFWDPILLERHESHGTTRWARHVGFISSLDSDDLSLKQLNKIETLEAILRAMEKGCFNKDQTQQLIWISNKFNLHDAEVLDDAVRWLERAGEKSICHRIQELGHIQTCYTTLYHIFTVYAQFIVDMGNNIRKVMREMALHPNDWAVEKCEEMKNKGNEKFQKNKYEEAVEFYSKAINFYPGNHLIYGNRALCYIRCKKYLNAVGDGKRATLLKPVWAKGHYRYCEALFCLGEFIRAIEANKQAQILCKDSQEGIKDLEQQYQRFISVFPEIKVMPSKQSHSKRPNSASRKESRSQPAKPPNKVDPITSAAQQSQVSGVKMDKQTQPRKNEGTPHTANTKKDSKQTKSELANKNGKGDSNASAKKKSKNENHQPKEEKVAASSTGVCQALRSAVQDGHSALVDLRSRSAEQAFRKALAILETSTPKEFGLSTTDVLLLFYGRASALTEIGQPQELTEAQNVLEKIKLFEERTFECLVYYGIGKVYLKENRYPYALRQFSDALQMVKNQITPGKLTWPMTKEIVKETQLDYFKELLFNVIDLCKFPPTPQAICRLENCLGPLKAEIYFTDPDFKGFIRIGCCQSCIVEYHITCWKALKSVSFSDKNEKDFLQEPCFTPDCGGQICCIKIFGSTGLIKCKFEVTITKPQAPPRRKVNQKCTSQKKLKSKEERKLRRMQHRLSSVDNQGINDDILLEKENSAAQSQQKAWLLYRDRVLLQISQNMEVLRVEKNVHVEDLASSLKPWLELDLSRGNQLAERMLSWQQQPEQTLDQAVEMILERKNRVWARVFLQCLSNSLDINPKLLDWARHLNDAGLNAAKSFIERHAGHLEELDLALLLKFGPLQDLILEKLGTRPEVFTKIGLTVTDYLKQAPSQDMRLFIWTLEEHRDQYVSCHNILDEYFEMMDGHCLILKKSENENQNNSPMRSKNRGRKKKKESKGVIVLSGMRGATPRDEWDQDFFDEDDSLSVLHPGDPFSVPSHLREHVADFEEQYNATNHRSLYKKILDNNPDPAKENLYDYFAQILEEHGPLCAQDPLLVGELDNFPAVAQEKIQEAGGFESFLLESLRFIKMGQRIGLAKHAVCLQQAGHGSSLDDLDDITDADISSSAPSMYACHDVFTNYLQDYSSVPTEVCPFLPNPYLFGSHMPQPGPSYQSYSEIADIEDDLRADGPLPAADSSGNQQYGPYSAEVDLYNSEVDEGLWESILSPDDGTSMTTTEAPLRKPAAVQACSSVAVNTEAYELFESSCGDINKKEKSNKELEQQINKMENDYEKINLRRKEAITSLEEDLQRISTNIQVTNTELALFQQKLEEEVKKDQKEKKGNQEALKSLKTEIEQLVEEQESLTRNIRQKNMKYQTQLNDFLELSNQSAAKRMSLEDEIKRCKDLCTKAKRRSQTAQLSMVESYYDPTLECHYKVLADARAMLAKLEDVAPRYPPQDLTVPLNTWRSRVQEAEKKIATTNAQYQEQISLVKKGSRMNELPPVNTANPPELPATPMSLPAQESVHQAPHQSTLSGPTPSQQSSSSGAGVKGLSGSAQQPQHVARTQEPQHVTVFSRALEQLTSIFSDYTRSDLMMFIQDLRSANGGSLSSMALQDVVNGVTQLILDQQERMSSDERADVRQRGSPAPCASASSAPPAPVWQALGPQKPAHATALNMEDPCIICHDDMSPDDVCVLECRHSFHRECIKSWLKEQSTCPTCREHALLPEDFPMLPGRRRRAHNPAAV
ncbi:E3 ubiquitin-protein ligase TTC3 [Myripristis murdjan]|uniref:E3 ubiquitin-protein ligase TTC3 n=1 Tax=Myripristis murdjan TaxID=586833 RepID=UPI001176028D|nr:E3 ubiquitin-protein ligase TTC3 [Myripristis murdjan]